MTREIDGFVIEQGPPEPGVIWTKATNRDTQGCLPFGLTHHHAEDEAFGFFLIDRSIQPPA